MYSLSFNGYKDTGVGDDEHSYSYDGSRTTLFPKRIYGKQWVKRDYIGCFIDLDLQEISFSQNGEHLGVAFSNFREKGNTHGRYVIMKGENGEYLPYFPALSVNTRELVRINLGGREFR